ncbi:uncharacterized protein PAC_02717 [Phialocephala subalpina]|uniref:Uncharacterized protein n=1 Tax=Phialocephala subalpina TaxID=576137 RepID=A0A1L7WJB4_9HELO|nr:uncharacterized protein PAC_02717 [Phialocephala subalpina]
MLPNIDEHPKETRVWVKCWFNFHGIDPRAEILSTTRQLEDELISWGFDYGHAAGIVKVIMDVRKIENKRKVIDFLANMKLKAEQTEQAANARIKQLSTAAIAISYKNIEAYIAVYLTLSLLSILLTFAATCFDLKDDREVTIDSFLIALAALATWAFWMAFFMKSISALEHGNIRAINGFLGLAEGDTDKNGVSAKQEDDQKEYIELVKRNSYEVGGKLAYRGAEALSSAQF